MVGMCAAPDANGLVDLVAQDGVGTTTGDYSRGLFRQMLGWIDYFGLQGDLVTYMLAVLDLADLPGAKRH